MSEQRPRIPRRDRAARRAESSLDKGLAALLAVLLYAVIGRWAAIGYSVVWLVEAAAMAIYSLGLKRGVDA